MNKQLITNFSSHKKEFLMIPLGGTNEIGMNITAYHYMGKWIIVDCGTCFANDIPGVKLLFPDLKFLLKHKKDILGLITTHCHEDHVGAVHYLWDLIRCPIYSTAFTINFLKQKFAHSSNFQKASINILEPDSKITIEPFELQLSTLAHSTLEMQSVMIKTEKGNILHTGDWKFDSDVVIGPEQNYNALKKFERDGVLALVCDSTNSLSTGRSFSEKELQENLIKIIKKQKNLVVVTTFGSNFCRLYSLFVAAKKANRKVVLSGKSMKRVFETAKKSGYFSDKEKDSCAQIISDKQMNNYSRSELLVIAAGCQGDTYSSFYSIVHGTNSIQLKENDTVVFSSKVIPGNEKSISALINKLILDKVHVITEMDDFVHVSGHPYVADLKKMYSLVKPKFSIPVHGEPIHLNKHAIIATECNVTSIVPTNGVVISMSEEESKIIGHVHSGYIALDGKKYLPINSPLFKTRKAINYEGAVIVTVILDSKKNRFIKLPSITFPGCLNKEEDAKLISQIKTQISSIIENNFDNAQNMSSKIYQYVRKEIKSITGKKPYVEVNVENVNL